MQNTLDVLLSETVFDMILTVLGAILILIIGFVLIKWLMNVLIKTKKLQVLDKSVLSFIQSFVSIALKILLILTVASFVGIPTASIIALIGSAGLAIGLALQGSLSNLAGGVMILAFKPFGVGDYIDTVNAQSGTVTNISIFYTSLQTFDNRIVVIPNSLISNNAVVNYSKMPLRRVDMSFSIAYETDIEFAKKILHSVASTHEKALVDPAPIIRISSFADSAMIIELCVWCNNDDYWDCYFDLNQQVKKAFDENGIVIPFMQINLRTDNIALDLAKKSDHNIHSC